MWHLTLWWNHLPRVWVIDMGFGVGNWHVSIPEWLYHTANRSGDVFEIAGSMKTSWARTVVILGNSKILLFRLSKRHTFRIVHNLDFASMLRIEKDIAKSYRWRFWSLRRHKNTGDTSGVEFGKIQKFDFSTSKISDFLRFSGFPIWSLLPIWISVVRTTASSTADEKSEWAREWLLQNLSICPRNHSDTEYEHLSRRARGPSSPSYIASDVSGTCRKLNMALPGLSGKSARGRDKLISNTVFETHL